MQPKLRRIDELLGWLRQLGEFDEKRLQTDHVDALAVERIACQTQAGLIILIATAAQITGDLNAIVADLLSAIGWMSGDGTPLTGSMAGHAAWNTTAVLRRVGALTDERRFDRRERPTLDGVSFTRAALTRWPAG
ncbi:MAG: hypothetical protein ACRDRG_14915 [Pseudonocardiaceae bacterium]